MTAPRRKPESVRVRVSFECDCPWDPRAATWEEYEENFKASMRRMWLAPLERLRVERVRAKPKGKRP